jgi:hypothetical protein
MSDEDKVPVTAGPGVPAGAVTAEKNAGPQEE